MVNVHSGSDKFFAFLSYVGSFLFFPFWLIPLLAKKDRPWVHNHARQGAFWYLVWFFVVVLSFVLLPVIPVSGFFQALIGLFLILLWIVLFVLLIFHLVAIIKIFQGEPFWQPFGGKRK